MEPSPKPKSRWSWTRIWTAPQASRTHHEDSDAPLMHLFHVRSPWRCRRPHDHLSGLFSTFMWPPLMHALRLNLSAVSNLWTQNSAQSCLNPDIPTILRIQNHMRHDVYAIQQNIPTLRGLKAEGRKGVLLNSDICPVKLDPARSLCRAGFRRNGLNSLCSSTFHFVSWPAPAAE